MIQEVKLENITKQIGTTTILENICLTMKCGQIYGITGENGSGKSTLIKGLLGLIPAGSGQVNYGKEISNHVIGYLPQQTQIQKDFPASVREIVLSGCQGRCGSRPFYNKEEKQLAEENIRKMQIENLSRRCYRELSGGQQQRVLLARALCAASRLLILDEPITGLDPAAAQELYRTLEYLNKQEGIAIVAVTHDIRSALRYADHILHAGHGTYFFGTAAEYKQSDAARRFLGGRKL